MACLRLLVRPGRPAMLPRLRRYATQWQDQSSQRTSGSLQTSGTRTILDEPNFGIRPSRG